MDSFNFDFDTDSTLTNDTNSNSSNLDWTAFQSSQPPMSNSPFSPIWLSQPDDAVAPDNRSTTMTTPHDDGIYFEIEHFFNGLNSQHQPVTLPRSPEQEHGIIEPIHVNIHIPDQTRHDIHQFETSHRIHHSSMASERASTCLPSPLVPRLSSSRSQCYHKLPDHAVKLMQEWYNANLDDPYPRSPDKKRFITEGNITAQQCRSWFANRRQRLKHVKRNHPRASSSSSSSSRLHYSTQARLTRLLTVEEQQKTHEHCYYCQQQQQQEQQQQQQIASSPLTLTSTPTTTATTLNVVINQQTVEQLIHNSLRKLLYPVIM